MRLAIDYRLLASPENIVNRGIGRYTQQQIRHVLQLDAENEYLLLCPPGSDASLVLPEIRAAANVSLCTAPSSSAGSGAAYQDWVHGLGVDLYHATSPFWLEQPAPLAWDASPMVATVYDLIPLIFPSAYLAAPEHQAAYARAARFVTGATRLLAISEGTRDDAAKYLGFDRGAIDCAWPFADACFRPLSDGERGRALRALDTRVRLPPSFVLTVAALHHSKNLDLLLAAYGRLSASFRRSMPLVVACHLDEGGVAHLRAWAGSYGVADDIVVTGYVSDEELVALYNRAALVVHPSRYEGFGLPVAEAMQCGAAVITTSAPTLPEVAGGAAVLVDPDDPTSLAAAIEALSHDAAARLEMGAQGRARAAAFTPEALAANTLDCYRKAVGRRRPDGGRRRVAVCAPVEPRTEDLVRALAARWDVDLFTDGPVAEEVVESSAVHDVNALGRCHEQHPFDAAVGACEGLRGVSVVDVVHGDGMGIADPLRLSPQLETVLARGRLGWAADRFVDLPVTDPASVDRDELLACDVVVVPGPAPARAVAMAAAAGKPMLLAGAADVGPEVAAFCEVVADPDRIADRLVVLAADRPQLARRSALARTWYERAAAPAVVAGLYADVLAGAGAPPEPDAAAPAGLNRLCQAEDLVSGDVVAWATAQARRAIGSLGRESRLLWLGEHGAEAAIALTTEVGEVTLAGPWLGEPRSPVGVALLVDPALVATGPFDPARLTARHADLHRLPFPSDGFDAVVSCLADDPAFPELARVVRPGGVVAATMTVRLHGPPGSPGLPAAIPECGLEPVDEVDLTLTDRTMRTRRRFHAAVRPGVPGPGDGPLVVAQGALLGYLHLALRKPAGGQSSG